MLKWIAALVATAAASAVTGAFAQTPQINASDLRFDTQALPLTVQAVQLWQPLRRSGAYTDAAMKLIAPGVRLNARNHAEYGPKTQPIMAAIAKRMEVENTDRFEPPAEFIKRAGAMLSITEWQALLDGLRPAGAATQSAIDATIAMGLMSGTGIEERTSPEVARVWGRLRATPSVDAPWGSRRAPSLDLLAKVHNATETIHRKLRSALEAYQQQQAQRTDAAALALARELFPDYASGKARRLGSAPKIDAFIQEVRMPEFARFYAEMFGAMRVLEVRLRTEVLAKSMGWPDNWDSMGGTGRQRMVEFILPRLNKLAADYPDSEQLADILSELISDADIDWMWAEWKSARGAKLMPTADLFLTASFWQRAFAQREITRPPVWHGVSNKGGVGEAAVNALRVDPNRRDAVIRRLEPVEQRAAPFYDRITAYQLELVRAAVNEVFKRDDKEIRAFMNTLK